MPKNHLVYWKASSVRERRANSDRLDHLASNQLGNASPGDTLWVVTVEKKCLLLVGGLTIGRIVDLKTAQRIMKSNDLWPGEYHAIAQEGTAQKFRSISLMRLLPQLRCLTQKGETRLAAIDGKFNPQQLQRARKLSESSASLLMGLVSNSSVQQVRPASKTWKPPRSQTLVQQNDKSPGGSNRSIPQILNALQDAGLKSFDLINADYRDSDRSEVALNGLCYVLAECLYHLFPGRLTPYRIRWEEGGTHWFLRDQDGKLVEPLLRNTVKAVCRQSDYNSAKRAAFLTKLPSKRARTLLERAGLDLP